MSRDDIIRMAREAGFVDASFCRWSAYTDDLERFAARVAALSARRGEPACPHIRSSGPADRATHWCALAATPPTAPSVTYGSIAERAADGKDAGLWPTAAPSDEEKK